MSDGNSLNDGPKKDPDIINPADKVKNPSQDQTADGIQSKVLYEIAQSPLPPGGSPRTKAEIRSDGNLAKAWEGDQHDRDTKNSFKTNPNPGGNLTALDTWLTQAVEKRVALIGKVYTKKDNIPNLRENLKQLRVAGKLEVTNPDLTPEKREQMTEAMKERDFSFWAVGVRDTFRPPDADSNEALAGKELQRLSGRKNGYVEGVNVDRWSDAEYETLHTIVFENLRQVFTLDKSWDDLHKKAAITLLNKDPYMQLNGANFKDDLERLHTRFLVAAVFAKTDETGRGYGTPFKRDVLNNFVISCWGDELKINGGWTPAIRHDIAVKYGVTEKEAERMHTRVKDMKEGRVV